MSYEKKESDGSFSDFGHIVLLIFFIITLVITYVFAPAAEFAMSLVHWMLAFHFDSPTGAALHLYLWIVCIPPAAILVLVAGGVVGGGLGGLAGGIWVCRQISLEGTATKIFGYLILGLLLGGGGLFLGGAGGFFLITYPAAMFILLPFWEGVCWIKDKLLHMEWMPEQLFGGIVYGVIPVALLVLHLLMK